MSKNGNVADVDIEELKARLTPEITARIIKRRDDELRRAGDLDIDEVQANVKLFEKMFRETVNGPKKPKLDKIERNEEINQNISKNLVIVYATDAGHIIKEKAHEKRSETMRIQREELRAQIITKVCRKCKIEKIKEDFTPKTASGIMVQR